MKLMQSIKKLKEAFGAKPYPSLEKEAVDYSSVLQFLAEQSKKAYENKRREEKSCFPEWVYEEREKIRKAELVVNRIRLEGHASGVSDGFEKRMAEYIVRLFYGMELKQVFKIFSYMLTNICNNIVVKPGDEMDGRIGSLAETFENTYYKTNK